MRFCPQCGAPLLAGAKFCVECGRALDAAASGAGESGRARGGANIGRNTISTTFVFVFVALAVVGLAAAAWIMMQDAGSSARANRRRAAGRQSPRCGLESRRCGAQYARVGSKRQRESRGGWNSERRSAAGTSDDRAADRGSQFRRQDRTRRDRQTQGRRRVEQIRRGLDARGDVRSNLLRQSRGSVRPRAETGSRQPRRAARYRRYRLRQAALRRSDRRVRALPEEEAGRSGSSHRPRHDVSLHRQRRSGGRAIQKGDRRQAWIFPGVLQHGNRATRRRTSPTTRPPRSSRRLRSRRTTRRASR